MSWGTAFLDIAKSVAVPAAGAAVGYALSSSERNAARQANEQVLSTASMSADKQAEIFALLKEAYAGIDAELGNYRADNFSAKSYSPEGLAEYIDFAAKQRGVERNEVIDRLSSRIAEVHGQQPQDIKRMLGNAMEFAGHNFNYSDATPTTDVSFREGVYSDRLGGLARDYYDAFSYDTNRMARDAFAKTEANSLSRGLGRSTYDIEARKGVADVMAQRAGQDRIKAVDAAIAQVASELGLDTGNQKARIAELGAGLQRSGFAVDSTRAALTDKMNTAGFVEDAGWNTRRNANADVGGVNSLAPNDYATGLGMLQGTNALRRGGIEEMVAYNSLPIELLTKGATSANGLGQTAISGSQYAANNYGQQAGSTMNAWGQMSRYAQDGLYGLWNRDKKE